MTSHPPVHRPRSLLPTPPHNFLLHKFLHKLLPLLLLLASLTACAHPEPTLVVVVGGLGLSQLGDLRHAIIKDCPQATVINAGAFDGYKSDIKALATKKPHDHIILVGHSFGCEAIASAALQLPNVELTVFIDPAWNDFHLPSSTAHYLWFQRSNFDIEREAKIIGASSPQKIPGGHNDIPHSPQLITQVVNAINTTTNAKDLRQTANAAPHP